MSGERFGRALSKRKAAIHDMLRLAPYAGDGHGHDLSY